MLKFWELTSILRSERNDLKDLLQDERWEKYRLWFANMNSIVYQQDREILDSIVPEELALAAMAICPERFQVVKGYLHGCPLGTTPSGSLSALETYKRFGGTAIEDTLEKGCVKVG